MFHLYGLLIGIGIVCGLWIASKQAKHFGLHSNLIEDSLLWILIPAVIGARTYHVLTDWGLYANQPVVSIVQLWNGGLGFFGALVGGVIGLGLFAFYQKEERLTVFFTLLDLLAFGAPLAQAIGRFGNFFNHELYGLPTHLPWGIWIGGQSYHPLFAYEAIGSIAIFILLNILGWKQKLVVGKGQYACLYIAMYGVLRFWLEFLRIETARGTGLFEIFSIAQWVSLGLTLAASAVFWLRRHADRGIQWELSTLL